MSRPTPEFTIAVPAWGPSIDREINAMTELDSLVELASSHDGSVVVLVNGAHPTLPDEQRWPDVCFVLVGDNVGVPAGWNLLMSAALSNKVVIINEDVRLAADDLMWMLEQLDDPDVGVAGLAGEEWDREWIWPSRLIPAGRARRPVPTISGFCFATKRTVWDRVLGFDERLSPAFFEEVDYSFSVVAAGFGVRVAPSFTSHHESGASSWANRQRPISWLGLTEATASINSRNHRYLMTKWATRRWLRVASRRTHRTYLALQVYTIVKRHGFGLVRRMIVRRR